MAAPACPDTLDAAIWLDASALARAESVARLDPQQPTGGWFGWLGPGIATLIALALRLPDLGRPRAVVFDETYYMKDALSLLLFGYERQAVKDADRQILDSIGDPHSLVDMFTTQSSFVVHPPLGKWFIASGEQIFGVTPFGWRIAAVVAGAASVLIASRILRRITRSNLIGTLAGILIAIDGLSIVMSRTAILDIFLMFLVLAGFGCIVLDRDWTRRRLARLVETAGDPPDGLSSPVSSSDGPPGITARLGWRPWLLAAGLCLGLACGVKWSGVYYLAAFGIMAVAWTVSARRIAGARRAWLTVARRDLLPTFLALVPIAILTYLATWTGWLLSDDAWGRQWASDMTGSLPWMPEALRALWHYHAEALGFHTGLTSPHSYAANPWAWPLQGRPTSFFYESPRDVCGADNCAQEVVALGNPIVWWAGVLAIIHQAWRWVARRDWRAGAVLCGFAAGWVPWLFFQQRTVFEFYSIVFEPFVVMALALSLGAILGPAQAPRRRRTQGAVAVGCVLLLAIAATMFFYPIWTGEPMPYSQWQWRMWLPSWV